MHPTQDEFIGDAAVAEFFGADADSIRETSASASPMAQVPPRAAVLIVHGSDDARVPIAHSRDYLEAAQAAGGDADLVELPRLSHRDAIAPAAPPWDHVHAWLDQRIDR